MVSVKKEKKPVEKNLIAVIRIRGSVNVNERIERTMKMLRLHKKHRCSVIPSTPANIGMINKAKDYCTYGEIDKRISQLLIEKRAKLKGDKQLTPELLKEHYKLTAKDMVELLFSFEKKFSDFEYIKPSFKLHPPIGGFERAGIKKPYSIGGSLGYRGADINKLLRKMI